MVLLPVPTAKPLPPQPSGLGALGLVISGQRVEIGLSPPELERLLLEFLRERSARRPDAEGSATEYKVVPLDLGIARTPKANDTLAPAGSRVIFPGCRQVVMARISAGAAVSLRFGAHDRDALPLVELAGLTAVTVDDFYVENAAQSGLSCVLAFFK